MSLIAFILLWLLCGAFVVGMVGSAAVATVTLWDGLKAFFDDDALEEETGATKAKPVPDERTETASQRFLM